MVFSLKGITNNLLEGYGDTFYLTGTLDNFNYVGPPDPTIWYVYLGVPTVDGSALVLSGAAAVLSLLDYFEEDLQTKVDFSAGTPTVGLWESDFVSMLFERAIFVVIGGTIWASTNKEAVGGDPQKVDSFDTGIPATGNKLLDIKWSSSNVEYWIDNILVHTTTFAPSKNLHFFAQGTGTVLIDFVILARYGKGHIELIETSRKHVFPEYTDVLQADAILSIGQGSITILEGDKILFDSVDYLVKNHIDVILKDEVHIERWGLWRDQTAPDQVTGVR